MKTQIQSLPYYISFNVLYKPALSIPEVKMMGSTFNEDSYNRATNVFQNLKKNIKKYEVNTLKIWVYCKQLETNVLSARIFMWINWIQKQINYANQSFSICFAILGLWTEIIMVSVEWYLH